MFFYSFFPWRVNLCDCIKNIIYQHNIEHFSRIDDNLYRNVELLCRQRKLPFLVLKGRRNLSGSRRRTGSYYVSIDPSSRSDNGVNYLSRSGTPVPSILIKVFEFENVDLCAPMRRMLLLMKIISVPFGRRERNWGAALASATENPKTLR